MKIITHTINILISLVVLTTSIGIPVIFNHIHNPEISLNQYEELEEVFCEEAVLCCETEEKTQQDSETKESNCDCNLLASCCCCFFEVELVAFSFDTPVSLKLPVPNFITAYTSELNCFSDTWSNSFYSVFKYKLPPQKTYSQQLSLFQVFRI